MSDKTKQSEIPDAIYNRIFQQDRDGSAILEELSTRFYDSELFVQGQPDKTNFNLGARSVILYIMQRAGTND